MSEEVLCIPADDLSIDMLFPEGPFTAVDENIRQLIDLVFESGSAVFLPRDEVEKDPDYKQIIPYVTVQRGNEWCMYERAGGEERLHNKLSLGFGGHVNPVDGEDARMALDNALFRELAEELGITPSAPLSPIGLLYDGSDEVGQVHLGFVYTLQLNLRDNVNITDPGIAHFQFMHRLDIKKRVKEFENWSQYVIKNCL